MTPNSSTTPYLSVPEFLARHDYRSVAQFANDNPAIPLLTQAQLDAGDPSPLYTNANVVRAVNAACGMLESACLRGQAYSPADLRALAAQADDAGLPGVSGEYMKTIVSNVAMYLLIGRRPGPAPPQTALDSFNHSMDQLDALSRGERIFAFAEAASAGVVTTQPMPLDQAYRNNMISARWRPFFGARQAQRRFF